MRSFLICLMTLGIAAFTFGVHSSLKVVMSSASIAYMMMSSGILSAINCRPSFKEVGRSIECVCESAGKVDRSLGVRRCMVPGSLPVIIESMIMTFLYPNIRSKMSKPPMPTSTRSAFTFSLLNCLMM